MPETTEILIQTPPNGLSLVETTTTTAIAQDQSACSKKCSGPHPMCSCTTLLIGHQMLAITWDWGSMHPSTTTHQCKLSNHPNKAFVQLLLSDFRHGCNKGYTSPKFAYTAQIYSFLFYSRQCYGQIPKTDVFSPQIFIQYWMIIALSNNPSKRGWLLLIFLYSKEFMQKSSKNG